MSLQPVEGFDAQLQDALATLRKNDWIIVTSTKAAALASSILNSASTVELLPHLELYAIGKSSARQLRINQPIAFPKQETSDGLLKLLQRKHAKEFNNKEFSDKLRKIIILKGRGGRPLLQKTLKEAGLDVLECDLYYRKIMPETANQLHWEQHNISGVIATSGELISAAFNHLDADRLKQLPWIVVSERMATIAKGYGITSIYVSEAANKEALTKAAIRFPEDKND